MSATPSRPKPKAMIWSSTALLDSRIASAAPKPDAAETPRTSGLTSGFRNIPWNAAPLIDRPAPTHIAMSARGSRIWMTIVSTDSGHDCAIGTSCAARIRSDVSRPHVQPADEQRDEQQQEREGRAEARAGSRRGRSHDRVVFGVRQRVVEELRVERLGFFPEVEIQESGWGAAFWPPTAPAARPRHCADPTGTRPTGSRTLVRSAPP